MTSRSGPRLLFAILLMFLPRGVLAQDAKPARTGLEISGFFGDFDDRPEIGPNDVFVNPAANGIFGGLLAYHFPQHFFIEAEGAFAPLEMRGRLGQTVDLDLMLFGGSLGYTIPLLDKLDLFGSVGAGLAMWNPGVSGVDTERDLMIDYGAGLKYFITPWLALRGDARLYQVPDPLDATATQVSSVTLGDESFWGWSFRGGLSLFIGGKHDADRDGVTDEMDACPDTPRGVMVDTRGCPVDSDSDGVADYMDQCPNTPAGARVDGNGCPTDSDNDGVFDGLDRCSDTPAGATVDANGCPSDSDRDGVFDGIDQCANTPAGATVDATGCPSDGDGDGVYDGLDQCPGTAPGSEVDAQGCPVSEVQRALEVEGMYTFSDVNFAFNSATLRPEAESVLQEVGRVLSGRPNDTMGLVGHTDSVGPEAYNQGLSLRRAQAVRDYLLEHFPDLDASRFTVSGMGESQPIADNGTSEGRAQNRRVEISLTR